MKKILVLSLLAAGAWFYFHQPAAQWRGLPAARDPVQTDKTLPAAFTHAGYTITPLATYQISAVVLSRSRYRVDAAADLAPLDLALGWGPMSAASAINDLNISQSGRWYEYSWKNEPPLDPTEISRHSANTHCLPADAEIRKRLISIKQHQLVSLEGYLVEVSNAAGYHWRSSLSRDDTRGGSCEVFWITKVESRSL